MGLFINTFDLFYRIMRVYLGGRQAGVPEQLFDGIQVGTPVEHVRGK